MKLVLKSISQDVSIEDPEQSTSFLVFQADVVPAGLPGTFRIQVTEDAVQELIQYLAAAQGEPQEPGEAGPDEEFDEGLEDDGQGPEDHQDEHPDVAAGAEEFPPMRATPAKPAYPLQQRQRAPLPREEDEDGVPSL